jgi:hypothetical protein
VIEGSKEEKEKAMEINKGWRNGIWWL